MTKGNNEDFRNSTKCCICDNNYRYDNNDIKVRDHCHITGKYRCSAHRDCSINLKIHYKIHVVFHSLKHYDSKLFMQQLGTSNLQINVMPNWLKKYTSFTVNNMLSFIDSFQLLGSSLHNLVKLIGNDGFRFLDQEFDNNVLDLVKRKRLHISEY